VPPYRNVEEKKGTGPFLAVTVVDRAPCYATRDTLHGPAVVNTNIFDAKKRYRDWTGPGHLIHGSDTAPEARRDLFLLLGRDADSFLKSEGQRQDGVIARMKRDLSGAHGWQSERQLLDALNCSVNYVLLGVDEGLDGHRVDVSGQGSDIDLLTDNYQETIAAMNARPAIGQVPRWGGRFLVKIGNHDVAFNLRPVGDRFFETTWQQAVLERRRWSEDGFFKPDDADEFETSIYHALIHHRLLPQTKKERLTSMATALGREEWLGRVLDDRALATERLDALLEERGYALVQPRDPFVYYNFRIAGAAVPRMRESLAALHRIDVALTRPVLATLRHQYLTVRDLIARSTPALRRLVRSLRGRRRREGFKAPGQAQAFSTEETEDRRLGASNFK
jgi:hypothetical protein